MALYFENEPAAEMVSPLSVCIVFEAMSEISENADAASTALTPIGVLRTCFPEKFGVPRQPGLAPEAWGVIELSPPFNRPEALADLERFSHVWIIGQFHQCVAAGWKASIRPPRLGGNRKTGVFASRSPFRPNHLTLSAVKLERVDAAGGRVHVSGVDLVDGTPVFDLKPYLPYADAIPEAACGYAPEPAPLLANAAITYSEAAEAMLRSRGPAFRALLERTLRLDPRPAYHEESAAGEERVYGLRLEDTNVRWCVAGCSQDKGQTPERSLALLVEAIESL